MTDFFAALIVASLTVAFSFVAVELLDRAERRRPGPFFVEGPHYPMPRAIARRRRQARRDLRLSIGRKP